MNLRGGHTGVIRGLRRMGGNYVNILMYEILKIRLSKNFKATVEKNYRYEIFSRYVCFRIFQRPGISYYKASTI